MSNFSKNSFPKCIKLKKSGNIKNHGWTSENEEKLRKISGMRGKYGENMGKNVEKRVKSEEKNFSSGYLSIF